MAPAAPSGVGDVATPAADAFEAAGDSHHDVYVRKLSERRHVGATLPRGLRGLPGRMRGK
jgi:hypothetical protein